MSLQEATERLANTDPHPRTMQEATTATMAVIAEIQGPDQVGSIDRIVEAMAAAREAVFNVVRPVEIDVWHNEVQVWELRDLECIPGPVAFVPHKHSRSYWGRAVKEYRGTRFFCLLEQAPEGVSVS